MLHISREFIRKSTKLLGYKIIEVSSSDPVIDEDETFKIIYGKCKEYTMTSKERMYALYKSVEYIINAEIPGDFVECGVWRGGSTMLIAYTLLKLNAANRGIYLYDTFQGMSEPSADDYAAVDKAFNAKNQWEKAKKKDYNRWCFSPLPEVKNNILSTGYPEDKTVFVKGKVEDTIPRIIPLKISLLRLDTDWYESTKDELTHLFPILVKSGVLIIDDYGWWAGSKKAVDEYFANKPILLNRIDNTGRIGIKIE